MRHKIVDILLGVVIFAIVVIVVVLFARAASAQFYRYPDYNIDGRYQGRNPSQGGGYNSRGDIWWSAPPARNYRAYPYYPDIRRQYQYNDYYNPGRPFLPGWNYR